MTDLQQTGYWQVSRLTLHIKTLLENDPSLYNIWVRGEVSDFKQAYSGHCYFKLKDQDSVINCVMFRSRASGVQFSVNDGMKILTRGTITVYEKGGNYQLIVEEMKPDGLGDLFLQFLQLKEKLYLQGYFNQERKRPIPFIPHGIGIATSLQGAGLQDMIRTIKKRFPAVNLYLAPTVVQGIEAPESIVNSIRILNACPHVEVIIVGRGGGSFEDLNCFNDERVAHAVYTSEKPVISGVGHETDFTICDMVADYRAETPTAAANAVVPGMADLKHYLAGIHGRMSQSLTALLRHWKTRLEAVKPEKLRRSIIDRYQHRQQDLDYLWERLVRAHQKKMENRVLCLQHVGEKLEALSPYNVLERGYAIVRNPQTRSIVSKAENIGIDDDVEIVFSDGIVSATTTGKSKPEQKPEEVTR